jgi:hypothetical protein
MSNSFTRIALVACALASIVACSGGEPNAPEGVDPSAPASVDTSPQALTRPAHTPHGQCPNATPIIGGTCHHVGLACPYTPEFCMQGQSVAQTTCIGTGNEGTWGAPVCPP